MRPDGASVGTGRRSQEAPRPLPVLHEERFAPWCEKARWALDRSGIAYRRRGHLPLLGEVVLRVAGRHGLRTRVSVPMLVLEDGVIMDSYRIARYAGQEGTDPGLFPAGQHEAIGSWNDRSERMMRAGRCLLLYRMRHMPRALSEQVPLRSPALRRVFRPMARGAVSYLMWKYQTHREAESARTTLIASMRELREALELGGGYLLESGFSMADVCMATALQFVQPVSDRYIPLGREQRKAWTDTHLASGFADLLQWRDELYRRHRHTGEAGATAVEVALPRSCARTGS